MAEGPGWPEALPLLPHPAELVIGAIAFGLLYLVYTKYVVPPLERMFAERTSAIEGGMERAEKAQAEAEAALGQYQAQLAGARDEAAQIREGAKQQGAQIIAEMRDQAQTESARITSTAQKQIEAERQQALVQLRGEVGRLSTDLASRIVGESLHDEARQRGIVDRFLDELESDESRPERVAAGQTEAVGAGRPEGEGQGP
jgi:F-type H+-transporting ATPase subunit b